MYERFISSSMLTGILLSAKSVMAVYGCLGCLWCKRCTGCLRCQGAPGAVLGAPGAMRVGTLAPHPVHPRTVSTPCTRGTLTLASNIQVLDVQCVVLDELAARLHLVAHERR